MGVGGNISRFFAAVVLVGFAAACSASDPPAATPSTTASPTPTSTTPSSNDADQLALRNLYTRLVDALGHHDTAAQIALTCTRYQDHVARRAEQDPMLNIDFFGAPDEVRRIGRDAATEKMYPALAPASKQAVEAVVDAMIEGNLPNYQAAVQRLKREGTTATLDKIDSIDITGDTATVTGSYTMRVFTSPPEVVAGANHAVRENGQWQDCTPPTH